MFSKNKWVTDMRFDNCIAFVLIQLLISLEIDPTSCRVSFSCSFKVFEMKSLHI